jgi:hypothetical protein
VIEDVCRELLLEGVVLDDGVVLFHAAAKRRKSNLLLRLLLPASSYRIFFSESGSDVCSDVHTWSDVTPKPWLIFPRNPEEVYIKEIRFTKLPPSTPVGFDLTTQNSASGDDTTR